MLGVVWKRGRDTVPSPIVVALLTWTILNTVQISAYWSEPTRFVGTAVAAALVLATHALCMPLLIRMGVTKGQWIYLLSLVAEFGVMAIIGNLGGEGVAEKISALALPIFLAALAVNVASMFVAAKMFDRRAEG